MDTARQDPPPASPKRAYCPPVLVEYGSVAQLTQAGTGTNSESDPANGAQCGSANKQYWIGPPCASDRALKENLRRVGDHPLGIGLYLFDYKPEFRGQWGHGRQFGVIAQEVEQVLPDAVSLHPQGYRVVDYGMLGIVRQPG